MAEGNSYRQILRATSIIGSSSAVSILTGIIRVKVLAMLLGPAGVGLAGLYSVIMSTVSGLAGMGLSSSGVRQIAEALGTGDERKLSVIRKTLWRLSLASGILGMGLLWMVREPVSRWMFGSTDHAAAVGWLGLGVLLSAVAGSQTALLQGYRRIGDLARLGMIGSVVGSVIAIASVYLLGQNGVIYFVLFNPIVSVLVAWRFAARLQRPTYVAKLPETLHQARTLIGLGLVFMITGLMQSVTGVLVRSWVTRDLGIDATGQFQAAWGISMQYIGYVLAAMSADYYPRLAAAIHDREQANRLVNEQAEVALLMAGPILLGMLTFAPVVIELFYSAAFSPAVDVLRWQVLGDVVKVFAWPIGFILLARGEGRIFFFTELAWNFSYAVFAGLGLQWIGLRATGIGFLLAYALLFVICYQLARRLCGFRSTPRNWWLFAGLAGACLVIQGLSAVSVWLTYGVGSVLVAVMGLYSAWRLNRLMKLGEWLHGKLTSTRRS